MILIAGATGTLGVEICRRLRARTVPVRAIVRPIADAARIAELEDIGVDLCPGDLTRPDSLVAACRDAETVISAATGLMAKAPGDSIASVDRDGQIALADAALRAGARHMVCISSSGKIGEQPPLVAAKRAVERHLKAIGLPGTHLRGGPFMDVWLGPHSGFDLAAGSVRILGSGTHAVTWIAREDVAEFAVLAALDLAPESTTVELGGPQALSQLQVVQIAEDIGGRRIDVSFLPEADIRERCVDAATPVETTLAELMLHVAGGDIVDMTEALARFPVRQTPVRDYVRRVLNGAAALSGAQ